jgi:hypothetical protein
MNNSKIMSVVITTIAAALLASLTVGFASHIFAQKDDSSNSGSSGSSSSTKDDYDKFQKCLSDAATDGSATKQQVKDCFDSTYGGGSSSGSDNTGSSRTGSDSGSNNDNNKANN